MSLIFSAVPGASAPEADVVDVTGFGAVPGDGADDTEALVSAIARCKELSSPVLTFPRGRYDFFAEKRPEGQGSSMLFRGINGLTIEGNGSELIFRGNTACFIFSLCKQVRVRNLTIDWERPPFSVGTIVNAGDKWFDVKVLSEYPLRGGEPVEAFMDFDPETHLPARHGLDVYYGVERTELVEPQVLRVHSKNPAKITTGLLAALRHQVYGWNAFVFDLCEEVLVEDVRIYTVPGMGLVGQRTKNLTLRRFDVLLKPGTTRLVSATADATHFSGCTGTLRIEDCLFEGMGDDAVNVKTGLYLTVLKKLDDSSVIAQHNLKLPSLPSKGDRIEISHVADLIPYDVRIVASAANEPDGTHRVSFTTPLPADLEIGDVLGNATTVPRLRVKGCRVRNNRARGMLIQTRDAVIEDCTFENCTSGGVWVMTEVVHFFESIGTRNVTVRNNTFRNCNYGGPLGEGVLMAHAYLKDFAYPPRPGVHEGIKFENNVINGADNSAIVVTGTDGITITGNTITNACRMPTHTRTGTSAIYIQSSRDVLLEKNRLPAEHQGEALREGLKVGPGASGLVVRDNDGIPDAGAPANNMNED